MPSERPAQRIQDVLKNIASIEAYTRDLGPESFAENRMAVDAVERCLERIAEAARKLGPRFDADVAAEVDLPALRRFGSVLRHDYEVLDSRIIWNAVANKIPPLKAAFKELAEKHPPPIKETDQGFDPFKPSD